MSVGLKIRELIDYYYSKKNEKNIQNNCFFIICAKNFKVH